jgi:1-acyl-sn-glycerol-3-phosphate acyltransferase
MLVMRQHLAPLTRYMLIRFGRLLRPLFFDVQVAGLHHLPTQPEPLLLIANHFSWFDPPLLALSLPITPAFLVATEAQERWWVATLLRIFDSIPIWRGQVDRTALRTAVQVMQQKRIVGLFPEGGINPELAERRARGEVIAHLQGNMGRLEAQLIRARSGAALLAVMSNARILPVGLLGTERAAVNLRRLRRTAVTVRIGAPFGPLTIEPTLSGQQRRRRLDELSHQMMAQVAELLPPDNRGYYQNGTRASTEVEV